jgi:hypothetical protein
MIPFIPLHFRLLGTIKSTETYNILTIFEHIYHLSTKNHREKLIGFEVEFAEIVV